MLSVRHPRVGLYDRMVQILVDEAHDVMKDACKRKMPGMRHLEDLRDLEQEELKDFWTGQDECPVNELSHRKRDHLAVSEAVAQSRHVQTYMILGLAGTYLTEQHVDVKASTLVGDATDVLLRELHFARRDSLTDGGAAILRPWREVVEVVHISIQTQDVLVEPPLLKNSRRQILVHVAQVRVQCGPVAAATELSGDCLTCHFATDTEKNTCVSFQF
jgi:hypothetical protein